jgi:hypothetical protein
MKEEKDAKLWKEKTKINLLSRNIEIGLFETIIKKQRIKTIITLYK